MTTNDFINKAIEISKLKTKYGKGTFGQKCTKAFLNQKAKQYPEFYTVSKVEELLQEGKNLYLFDCVGLIKGIIWGYPDNGVYKSNDLKDVTDQGLWDEYVINKSKDFSKIKPGNIVHIKGHVGIYIGDNKVIEATNRWTGNVLTSYINKGASFYRSWDSYGTLKLLEGSVEHNPENSHVSITYIVKRGDCMYSIAKTHNMSLNELIALNPQVKVPSLIYPGQILTIRK